MNPPSIFQSKHTTEYYYLHFAKMLRAFVGLRRQKLISAGFFDIALLWNFSIFVSATKHNGFVPFFFTYRSLIANSYCARSRERNAGRKIESRCVRARVCVCAILDTLYCLFLCIILHPGCGRTLATQTTVLRRR